MNYTSRLDGTQITIAPCDTTRRYGIMLSGGFDSAVLLDMMIENGYANNLQPFTIPKVDGSHVHATNVINHYNQKYNISLPPTINVGDITVYHRQMSTTAWHDINDNHRDKCDVLFNALNQVHPEVADGRHPDRTRSEPNDRIKLPFVDLYKTHIVDFMFERKLEAIMPITHSCTERPDTRCNVCWQCGERAWAFTKLNQVDTGTI
jgi:7-cyano-7-deazaguanine synthase in queuosine biosynthesis